jgi:hypothetical protein
MTAILALGALALAAPASAQIVNGISGPDYNHEAPIGTKAGGSDASLQAPGEAAAVAGALRNEMDAKNMQPTNGTATVVITRDRVTGRTTARADTDQDRLENAEE